MEDRTALLEQQELEAAKGVASPQVYSQLLALYLYQNDLHNAKYLWKRIPPSVESANLELYAIWSVGKKMWKRDFPGIYQALAAHRWSETVADIMISLEDKVRERAIALISQAYSSLSIEAIISMTGLSEEKVLQLCQDRGWIIDESKMVTPKKPLPPPSPQTSSEDQLYKLTDFVTFLEN